MPLYFMTCACMLSSVQCFRYHRSAYDWSNARAVKERHLYVPPNDSRDAASTSLTTLPDGRVIALSPEHASLGEAFFQPSLIGLDSTSFTPLHTCALRAREKCSLKVRTAMGNVVTLSGGHAVTPGIMERLARELGAPMHKHQSAAELHAWLGGSIVCSLGNHHKRYVSRQEYAEYGAPTLDLFIAALPDAP